MNIYLVFILGTLLFGSALGVILEILNCKALRSSVPPELADVFDHDKFLQAQNYARAQARQDITHQIVSTLALSLFISFGGFAAVHQWSLSAAHPLAQGLLFFAILFLLNEAISIPFSIYHTFVVEAQFGFNKTSWATYWLDKVKGYLLMLALGTPLLTLILWLFAQAGSTAWLWCWLVMTIFSLAITYIAPTWILPLFNKFTPLETGDLRTRLEALAQATGFQMTDISVMDGSKRSTKSNAYFTGLGKRKRIALFDTLISRLTHDEIAAVLAHEIGHCRCGHITKRVVLSILQTGIIFYTMSFFLNTPELFQAFGLQTMPVHAGLVFFSLLFSPISLALTPAFAYFSRVHEFEADRFAKHVLHSPEPLAQALKKLSADNLSNITPHPWYVFFHYSHPPILARLQALRSEK